METECFFKFIMRHNEESCVSVTIHGACSCFDGLLGGDLLGGSLLGGLLGTLGGSLLASLLGGTLGGSFLGDFGCSGLCY